MGMKEAVLGEAADRPLRRTALIRRIRRRHPLAGWQERSTETTVDALRREGLLAGVDAAVVPADEPADPREDPTPLQTTAAGRDQLRAWQRTSSPTRPFREDLLLQIAASDEQDLPELDAMVRARLTTVAALEAEIDEPMPVSTGDAADWRQRRLLVARALDLGVLDGLARGLRRAHAEIVDAMERDSHQPRTRGR
jgi:hypothetical protein